MSSGKTLICQRSGKPITECRFKDDGIPHKSPYNPGTESGAQRCEDCGEIRFYTRKVSKAICDSDGE